MMTLYSGMKIMETKPDTLQACRPAKAKKTEDLPFLLLTMPYKSKISHLESRSEVDAHAS
jgi:hypothetical protein